MKLANFSIESQWVRLGFGLNSGTSDFTPDVESLIVSSARCFRENSRLTELVVSWLARNGDYVAKHRLKGRISQLTDVVEKATLGLVIESAIELGASPDFACTVVSCELLAVPQAISLTDEHTPYFRVLAEETARDLSRKWACGRSKPRFEMSPLDQSATSSK